MQNNSQAIVEADLDYICEHLHEEFSKMSGNNVLIVGGAGFLGYYLVQSILHWNQVSLISEQINLTVYDNYIRGVPPWLESLRGTPHLTLARHDISTPLPADMPEVQFIIHAGSIASPAYYRKYPIETMDANVGGLRRLLDYANHQRLGNRPFHGFLFFSSSEIYGDPTPDAIPTSESYRGFVSCTGPRACYDEAKRYGETLCVNFAKYYGIPVKIARPFNNYGPGLKITDRRVIPDFARDILAGRDIELRSDGSPRRTFCYVADAVVGYFKVLVNGSAGEPYNVGNETPEISMYDLAETLAGLGRELTGYAGKVVIKLDPSYLIDNPERRCPSIAKARAELDFDPGIDLAEGLRRTMIWYSGNREASEA